MENTQQILQTHVFMISHPRKLVKRGGREVPPTNHLSEMLVVVLLLASPAPPLFSPQKAMVKIHRNGELGYLTIENWDDYSEWKIIE